jgi:hypothetical protein
MCHLWRSTFKNANNPYIPRGDVAILKAIAIRLDASGLSQLRDTLRAGRLPVGMVANLRRQLAANPARARKVVLAFAGASVLLICITALWRHTGRVALENAATPSVASRNTSSTGKGIYSSSPRPADKSRPYSSEYKILLTRSLFASDGSAGSASPPSITVDAVPPSTFALKGISQEDANFTAFVEDTNARRVVELHPGDTLGQGQIRDINLHALNYEIAGKLVRVEIGQGLDGNPFVAKVPKVEPANNSEHKHKHGSPGGEVRASTLDDSN